jgi:hypothetical protein
MNDANFILEWTENLKKEIINSKFQENDIRKDYFKLTHGTTYQYYRNYLFLKLSEFIYDGKINFHKDLFTHKIHVDRISETCYTPIQRQAFTNNINRSMFIDSWSIFELCVTTFCSGLCTNEELDKLLKHQFNDLINILNEKQLTDNEKVKLEKFTLKEHLTHVPIVRKTDFLFKKAINYSRNKNADKEFLLFYGKFRNTMHTNFIYFGKDYEYYFGDAHFVFINNKIVTWDDPFLPSPKLYFNIIDELKGIWKELISTIPYDGLIEYPDIEQE